VVTSKVDLDLVVEFRKVMERSMSNSSEVLTWRMSLCSLKMIQKIEFDLEWFKSDPENRI
jgi:hypothetical protein